MDFIYSNTLKPFTGRGLDQHHHVEGGYYNPDPNKSYITVKTKGVEFLEQIC